MHAVDDVSLSLPEGETLGIVGESGCGKSTLARCMVRLLEPTAGTLRFRGRDITHLGPQAAAAIPPRGPARLPGPGLVAEPAQARGPDRRHPAALARDGPRRRPGTACGSLLDRVGLNPEHVNRFPHEFSGGQRQRIGVARALAVNPKLIVLDEPVSALDVSIQAQVINLLDDLQDDLGLSYVFIAHDLSVVRHVSDQIAVMYLGKLMELSPAAELYSKPIHPYTAGPAGGDPDPGPAGEPGARARRSSAGSRPTRSTRRPAAASTPAARGRPTSAREVEPPLAEYPGGHLAACHHPRNVSAAEIAAATRSPLSPLSAGELMPGARAGARRQARENPR